MLNINESFNKAIENFPKWMDIRKRANKSRGGKYLLSIIEELTDIQDAITDMKKSFFLVNYAGKEDSVLAYVYIAQVGNGLNISLSYEDLELTTDINEFYNAIDSAVLYQDGYLSVSENVAKKLNYEIEYVTDDKYLYQASLKSYAVWNIFDEFAMFFGLERLENESNKELANRCYLVFKNRTNCSEPGLKNSIINLLSNYEAISEDEIKFYRLDEIDIVNTEIEDKSIYETVSELNKDIYRYKKWNHDVWDHDFAYIEYLPHIWNHPLRSFQNGTGNNDDCKIVLSSEENTETTDITVVGYQASELLINEYIHDHNIEQVIPVTLTRYNDVLKTNDVQFQITASEVQEIDISDITIEQYESQEGTNKYYISDIIDNHSDNIVEEKRNLLEANTSYRLKFEAYDNFSEMKISKCELSDPERNLLVEQEQFVFDEAGNVINKDVVLHINNVQNFAEQQNMMNVEIRTDDDVKNGFTIGQESKIGNFSVYLENAANQSFKFAYSCKESNITNNNLFVTSQGFEAVDSKTLRCEQRMGDNFIKIDMNCNYLSFEIAKEDIDSNQGSCNILVEIDGEINAELSGIRTKPKKIIIDNKEKWLPVSVKITKVGNKPLEIKNISAKAFEIDYSLDEGEISVSKLGTMRLPNINNNVLYVTVTAHGTFAPVFEYLHVGPALGYYSDDTFVPTSCYTIDFTTESETEIDIDSTCKVSLYKGEELISNDYVTKSIYKNDSITDGYIEIHIDDFIGEYKTSPEVQNNRLYLSAGKEIEFISVQGTTLKNIESKKLSKLIDIKDAKFYVSNSLNGIIRRDSITSKDSLIQLDPNFLQIRAEHVKVDIGDNKNITTSFLLSGEDIVIYGTEHRSNFSYIRFTNTNTQVYLAYNTVSIFTPTVKNIEMVHNFSPLLDKNKLVVYQIKTVATPNTAVMFEKNISGYTHYQDWSFGYNELGLTIFSDADYSNKEVYDAEIRTEKNKYVISQNIPFKTDNIAEYVVTVPENMSVHYDKVYYEESFYVEEDGFNKLRYSNIDSVEEIIVDGEILEDYFEVLNEQGIIVWRNKELDGKLATIRYYYNEPVYMYYTDINDLYKIVGYTVSAYEAINKTPLTFTGLKDGESVIVSFEGKKADKVIVNCSNYQFISQITDNERITVYYLDYQDKIGIHNGYLYQDGYEYWLFANKFLDTYDNYNGVILDNVKRYGEQFMFSQTATNFLPYSTMEKNTQREVCYANFIETERLGSVSLAGNLTVLNSYDRFFDSGMDVALVSGSNGLALKFTIQNEDAYSILEITKYLRENTYLSISGKDIKIYLAEDLDADTFRFTKSFCANIVTEILEEDGVYSIDLTSYQTDKRLFLVFKGNGFIDDLIIKDKPISKDAHTKTVDKIGFSVLNTVKKDFIHELYFTNNNNIFGLDVSKELDVSCGSTVDWDLTQVYKLSEDKNITRSAIDDNFGLFEAEEDGAYILSAPILITNKRSVKDVVVKINNLSEEPFKGYTVTLYTANSLSDNMKQLDKQTEDNVFIFNDYTVGSYLQIKAEMMSGKKIQDIDVLLKYRETEDSPLVVQEQQSGYLITQVYDTCYKNTTYELNSIDFDYLKGEEFIKIEMRGCRENDFDSVWTDWHEIYFDKSGLVGNAPVFENYHLFQFKVTLLDPIAKVKINSFNVRVVS